MELIITFLKAWSLIYSLIIVGFFYFLLREKNSNMNINFDWKTCTEWAFYLTSLTAWYY